MENNQNTAVPSVQIDGKTLPISDLNQAAKIQVQNMAIVDVEIKRLQTQIAIAQAAQSAFAAALRAAINPADVS